MNCSVVFHLNGTAPFIAILCFDWRHFASSIINRVHCGYRNAINSHLNSDSDPLVISEELLSRSAATQRAPDKASLSVD